MKKKRTLSLFIMLCLVFSLAKMGFAQGNTDNSDENVTNWYEWYNSLTPEEQGYVNFVPNYNLSTIISIEKTILNTQIKPLIQPLYDSLAPNVGTGLPMEGGESI